MTHFGIICPAATGHLNPMTALGYELQKRGHRVTVLGIPDAKAKALTAGLEFQAIGQSDFPLGASKALFTELGNLKGLKALNCTINWVAKSADICLRDAPQVIKTVGIEALIVDQVAPQGGTVAEYLDIPFVSACGAMMLNGEISIPPFSTSWQYDPSWRGLLRNRLGYELLNYIRKPTLKTINDYRQQWNLPIHSNPNDNYSRLAQLSQQPAEFEFPRKELPSVFHFTGLYNNPDSRQITSFPDEKLTGQPLIYASMGTVQNRLLWVFQMIAEACGGLDIQLVIALGGGASPESLPELPGNTLVVGYAPQLELLQKATLTITHAGMNTTLESLSNGVPMLAIPITNDQPGVAARIAWTGCGEVIPLAKVNAQKLKESIKRLLREDSYKNNALRLQEAIKRAGGVSRAGDIIEQVIRTGKPLFSETPFV
jgi:zeaxanthin glucosyltransferase